MNKHPAFNPYLPSYEYVPDGEPRVFGERLYVYGSHDRFGGKDFCMNDYVCWSAPLDDLGDWRYEGVIYRATQDPRNKDGKMHMNAPDCVQGPDGRYYLFTLWYNLREAVIGSPRTTSERLSDNLKNRSSAGISPVTACCLAFPEEPWDEP